MDAVVELARLSVGDSVEIDAVEILKRGKLIAVEAGGAGVGEIVLGFCPPILKLLSRLPGSERMVPGVIAVPPQARQVHPSSMLGFHITRQLIERPKMIMRVDRGDRIEKRFDFAIGRCFPRAHSWRVRWPGSTFRTPGVLRG